MRRIDAVCDELPPARSRHQAVEALAVEYAARVHDDAEMHVKTVAEVEPTEEVTGEVTALVSDYGVDRTNERFVPGAWDNAIRKIRQKG